MYEVMLVSVTRVVSGSSLTSSLRRGFQAFSEALGIHCQTYWSGQGDVYPERTTSPNVFRVTLAGCRVELSRTCPPRKLQLPAAVKSHCLGGLSCLLLAWLWKAIGRVTRQPNLLTSPGKVSKNLTPYL